MSCGFFLYGPFDTYVQSSLSSGAGSCSLCCCVLLLIPPHPACERLNHHFISPHYKPEDDQHNV